MPDQLDLEIYLPSPHLVSAVAVAVFQHWHLLPFDVAACRYLSGEHRHLF
jgi:hypothetical protein